METDYRQFKWFYTEGGLFALLPDAFLESWEGVLDPSGGRTVSAISRWNPQPGAVATDYDRACDVVDHAKVLDVGSGWGLIINTEAEGLALARNAKAVVTFLFFSGRRSPAPPERDEEALRDFLNDMAAQGRLMWQAVAPPVSLGHTLSLIDAADSGRGARRDSAGVALALSPGTCVVEKADFALTSEYDAWTLIRLRKVEAGTEAGESARA